MWEELATCRDRGDGVGYPQSWFFADRESGGDGDESALPGLELCHRCPVQQECLGFALSNKIDVGIFGATTGPQRVEMRRSLRETPSRP